MDGDEFELVDVLFVDPHSKPAVVIPKKLLEPLLVRRNDDGIELVVQICSGDPSRLFTSKRKKSANRLDRRSHHAAAADTSKACRRPSPRNPKPVCTRWQRHQPWPAPPGCRHRSAPWFPP